MPFTAFARYLKLATEHISSYEGPWPEEQRGEYESGLVAMNGEQWRIRTARVTPTKPGAFVAVWKRDENGETRPFAREEAEAGLLLFVEDGDQFGVFRFSAAHLEELGITSSATKPGKRGFRVYPSWCTGLNPQASRTQAAQSRAFAVLA
ncbi:MepB family protein [Leucobacter coleopterorum]|uniref:MepB family protein n=1 Tax=Leucobacter coleopterorum TaxID=2714933 RepID=A0ABX6JWB9_9MICO|nr:MepB family protein [Leucobacter coleopterorum]QIM18595.1 MepB family protein [Leucobacter coleopterorum]